MKKTLQDYQGCEFTLDALVKTTTQLIQEAMPQPSDGRIAPFPDERTIRYYQTVGTLKKPLRYEGRNAIYSYLHLLQLIVIKLLQRQGLSLAQIQSALLGSTLSDLEKILKPIFEEGDRTSKKLVQRFFSIQSSPLSMGKMKEEIPCGERGRGEYPQIPIYQKPRKEAARNLIAKEIAPGISILIDPEVIKNPDQLIDWITKLLNSKNGESE
jgi:DNA-binding transcriptional MerR regulator